MNRRVRFGIFLVLHPLQLVANTSADDEWTEIPHRFAGLERSLWTQLQGYLVQHWIAIAIVRNEGSLVLKVAIHGFKFEFAFHHTSPWLVNELFHVGTRPNRKLENRFARRFRDRGQPAASWSQSNTDDW